MPRVFSVRRRAAYIPPVPDLSKLLLHVPYEPASTETKTVTSTTPANADATNLVATFTPNTSRVLAVIEGVAYAGGSAPDNVVVSWNLRDSGGDLFPHQRISQTVQPMRHRFSRVISVTPDQEVTWYLGLRSSSATIGANIQMGGTGASAVGPFDMWFYSIAEGTEDLLGLVQHNPDPAETPSTSSSDFVDLDADLALSFTRTPSGLVLVELEGYGARRQKWTLRDGETNLTTEDGLSVGLQTTATNLPQRLNARFFFSAVSGSKTWDWGYARIVDTAEMFYGTDYGTAEMRVWAIEDAA